MLVYGLTSIFAFFPLAILATLNSLTLAGGKAFYLISKVAQDYPDLSHPQRDRLALSDAVEVPPEEVVGEDLQLLAPTKMSWVHTTQ